MVARIARRTQERFRKRKDAFADIAQKRIEELFSQAELVFKRDTKLSDRYIFLARKLSSKFKVPFTSTQKMVFCKKCGVYLKNNVNSKTRLSSGQLVLHCLNCKHIRRFRYK